MKLAPKDWRPVSLMALALDQDKRPDEALASYQEALRLSPENPAILSNLALYYAVRKNIPEAEALLRRAVAQPGATAQERQNLALVLGLQGKSLEAEHWMRQDLPPEAADANLSYLEAAATPFARSPASAPAASSHASGRTWGSLTADGSAVVR
jgi:Flp pilus assembly protein TadD